MSKRHIAIAVTVVCAAAVICVCLYLYFFRGITYNTSATPTFQTVLPKGVSIHDLGGWKRVSPPSSDPVFAYNDTIDNTPVSVSEQELPKGLDSNPDQVAELAKKFNATTVIDVDGTKVYIGTSAKGPQSVIFTKKRLLILIKSQKVIDNTSWTTYIKSLR